MKEAINNPNELVKAETHAAAVYSIPERLLQISV